MSLHASHDVSICVTNHSPDQTPSNTILKERIATSFLFLGAAIQYGVCVTPCCLFFFPFLHFSSEHTIHECLQHIFLSADFLCAFCVAFCVVYAGYVPSTFVACAFKRRCYTDSRATAHNGVLGSSLPHLFSTRPREWESASLSGAESHPASP